MSLDPRRYYDTFSATYDRRRGHGYHALIDEIEAGAVRSGSTERVLEAGCGTGLVLERLRSRGAQGLFGIDLSAGMLTTARQHGFRVAQASVTALPFPDASFDVAYSFKVLAHVPDIKAALAEMARVVRPGGTLVLEFYNRRSLRGLRWALKRLAGGEATGRDQRETELFTRYDTVREAAGYLPGNTVLEGIRGAIVVTPAAAVMRLPLLARLFAAVERRLGTSVFARYAGFLILVVQRR
jgi:ubiquinone/menaquinone biosynthesis C-methylase UbiE